MRHKIKVNIVIYKPLAGWEMLRIYESGLDCPEQKFYWGHVVGMR